MSSVIDDYEPLEVIGNGSFGVIRKVKRHSDGQLFARKELSFERMTDRDRKQIVAEVNILKDLKHENIVKYMNRYVDHESRTLYILMEYCGGGDLGAIINLARRQSRPLPEEQIWNFFVQILLALHHCHNPASRNIGGEGSLPNSDASIGASKQVLHRDLKPENVFLSTENEIKLGDFGLAKQIAAAAFASTYVGTPYYMSPELMSEKAYDTKSDIWSLGCMIYEMCALRAPFHDAQTYNELATAIRSGRIPPLPKGYSAALSNVIKSMLNINPAMRPSTQQLLKTEQLLYAKKLIDVNKMIPEIRRKHEAILSRENAAALREHGITQREAAVQAFETQLIARSALIETERAQLAIQKSQIEADGTILEKARSDVAQAREEFENQVLQAKNAYEAFSKEKTEFMEEKDRWQQEVLSRMMASPLEDVKNTALHHTSYYVTNDETPTKVFNELSLQQSNRLRRPMDDDTPLKVPHARKQHNIPPVPPLPTVAFQRLQGPQIRKPTTIDGPSLSQQETPRRLTSSKSLTDLGSAMKGVILTDTGDVLPTPVRRDTTGKTGPSLLESDDSSATETSRPPSRAGERQRLPQRRSILQSQTAARPPMQAVASSSTVPTGPSGSMSSATVTSEGITPSACVPSSTVETVPVWNYEDEENLPSPFAKRGVDFSQYTRNDRSFAGSGVGGAVSLRTGAVTSKPRTSMISKALKASGEAQRALAKRQADSRGAVVS